MKRNRQLPRGMKTYERSIGAYALRKSVVGVLLTTGRTKAGRTQLEVAEALGISRGQVANVEGGRSSIAGEMIYEWAEFCGVSCKALCRALAEDFRE